MNRMSVAAVLLLAALAGCIKEESISAPMHITKSGGESLIATEGPAEIEGTLIVELDSPFASSMRDASRRNDVISAFKQVGARTMERVFYVDESTEASLIREGMDRWYRVKFPISTPVREAKKVYEAIPGVKSVEVERRVCLYGSAPVNDTYYGKLWGMKNNDYAGIDINVELAWAEYSSGKSGVIVEIQDGGIDLSHEDLAAVTMPVGKGKSRTFMNSGVFSAHSHGTHVAGTVAAIGGNGKGVAGVAGGTGGKGGVTLMSCQVFTEDEKDKKGSDMANAMIYAAQNGAVISQNSWGYVYNKAEDAKNGGVGYMKSAIDYFIKYAGTDLADPPVQKADSPMKGGLVVFAAGNDNFPDGWPAEYDGCVAVGALANDGKKAEFSNYGPWVDICAPGVSIYSCLPGSQYGYMDGTSMACPHVSGVAALIVSQFGGQGFTCEMLRERLLGGASYSKIDKSVYNNIGPLVDAYGSMKYGGTVAPDPVDSYTTSVAANNITFKWKVTKDDDAQKAYAYLLLASPNQSDFNGINLNNLPATVKTASILVDEAKVGESISGVLGDLEFEKTYYVSIAAYDFSKNYSAIATPQTVTTLANNPPEITTDYTGDYKVKSHLKLDVAFSVVEPDGHKMEVKTDPGSAAATFQQAGASYILSIKGNGADPGTYTATITATDKYKLQTKKQIEYELLPNHPPVVLKQVDNMMFSESGQKRSLDMTEYLYDEDGENLGFQVSCNPTGVVHLYPNGNTLNLTTLDYGMTTVTITAKDARTSTDLVFKVLVREAGAAVDVYPNPVDSVLNVSNGGEPTVFDIVVSNSAGAVLFDGSLNGSAFDPAKVDMRGYAPGVYGVKIGYGSETVNKTIVKI